MVLSLIFLAGAAYLFLNEYGIMKYYKLERELDSLKAQITFIEKENKRLETEIDSLEKKIPAKIEKVAREKYNMIREGETAIEVVEE